MTVNICHFESELSDNYITVDKFWGPIAIGHCIQLTGEHGYIQLTIEEINDIVKVLSQHGIVDSESEKTFEEAEYKKTISNLNGDIHNLRMYMEDQEKTIEGCFEDIKKLRKEIDDCHDTIEQYMRVIAKQQIKIETFIDDWGK